MRVLDEVAAAIRVARRMRSQPIVSAFGLQEQFGAPITPEEWATIERRLACPLPHLVFAQGHWFLPESFTTIWNLVDHASDYHPDWDRPVARTVAAWREAQVFAGVRMVVADSFGVELQEVTRETRLADLD